MSKSRYQNIVMLFLMSIFIAGSGLIVLYGARFYSAMTKQAEINLQVRSATLYFNHRFKQGDVRNALWLSEQDGLPVLTFDHGDYFTLIYEDEGKLVEQVSETELILEGAGQVVADVHDLRIEHQNNVMIVSFSDGSGLEHSLNYTLMTLGAKP